MNRRRAVHSLLATAILPVGALAQPRRVRVVGFLAVNRPRGLAEYLRELGYVEGANLRFEVRLVPEVPTREQLERAAAELAASGAEVIVSSGANHVTALFRATRKIPIVSGGVSNPVTLGLARTLREPGLNVTGLSYGLEDSAVLQFGVLKQLRPRLKRITFLIPASDPRKDLPPEFLAAGTALGLAVEIALLKDMVGIEKVVGGLRDSAAEAIWVREFPAPVDMKDVAALAIRHRVAAHAPIAELVGDGFLASCWLYHSNPAQRVAAVVDKVLRGTDPGTIPFEMPDRFDLALNQATAAEIGARIPDDLRLRATQIFG